MSRHEDGTVYCDYIRCHLVIATADPSQLHFLEADYHGPCFLAELREKKAAANPRPAFATALLLALLVSISFGANGDEPRDVRGCLYSYDARSGKISFEPFLMVQEKASLSEDGQPEVWGFRPWNLEPPDEHGLTKPVNVLKSRFLTLNRYHDVQTGTASRRIRCPAFDWKGDPHGRR